MRAVLLHDYETIVIVTNLYYTTSKRNNETSNEDYDNHTENYCNGAQNSSIAMLNFFQIRLYRDVIMLVLDLGLKVKFGGVGLGLGNVRPCSWPWILWTSHKLQEK